METGEGETSPLSQPVPLVLATQMSEMTATRSTASPHAPRMRSNRELTRARLFRRLAGALVVVAGGRARAWLPGAGSARVEPARGRSGTAGVWLGASEPGSPLERPPSRPSPSRSRSQEGAFRPTWHHLDRAGASGVHVARVARGRLGRVRGVAAEGPAP